MRNLMPFTDDCLDPVPLEPSPDLAIAPRPWLSRLPDECAFPVDGEGWLTRSCCNPSVGHRYCGAHERLMRVQPDLVV
jgi:hypothetical protein